MLACSSSRRRTCAELLSLVKLEQLVFPLQVPDANTVLGTDMHKLMHSFEYDSFASNVLHKAKHKHLDHAHRRIL